MKKMIKILMIVFLFSGSASAQLDREEQLIVKAMRDQLAVSMDSLKLGDFPRPNFIEYIYKRGEISRMRYRKGALYEELIAEPVNLVRANLVVKDKNGFTNLNFDKKGFAVYSRMGGEHDGVAIQTDYDEIRRALWLLSDRQYKSAIRDYEAKMRKKSEPSLSENVKKEMELPDFQSLTAVKYYDPFTANPVDVAYWHDLLASVSGIYNNYEGLFDVSASVDFSCGNIYTVNTENTEMRQTSLDVTVHVTITVRNENKQYFSETLSYLGSTAKDMPSKQEILDQTNEAVKLVLALSEAELADKEYVGPAIVDAPAVIEPQLYNSFTASRIPAEGMSYRGNSDNIGIRFCSSIISMTATPTLKEFNGKKLLGSYAVDADGVKPDAELLLVEKGILKRLLNDRIPTQAIPQATGHLQYDTYVPSMAKVLMPGVLQVNSSVMKSAGKLKSELMNKAKEDGVGHAFIVRRLKNGTTNWFYKVNVQDGTETLVRGYHLNARDNESLRRIVASSDNKDLFYLKYFGKNNSVISPEEFLFEEVNISK